MSATDLPPPAHPRCQVYTEVGPDGAKAMERCPRPGTHWVKWAGCSCIGDGRDDDDCLDDFYSWECDEHDPVKEAA